MTPEQENNHDHDQCLSTDDCQQEKKWREEFKKKYPNMKHDRDFNFIWEKDEYRWRGYLEACKAAQVEIDERDKNESELLSEIAGRNVKIKYRDQEIERLKKQVNFFKGTELAEMVEKLKERDELIKEATHYARQMLWDARTCGFPEDTEEYEVWLEKARKLVGEV